MQITHLQNDDGEWVVGIRVEGDSCLLEFAVEPELAREIAASLITRAGNAERENEKVQR